MIFQHTNLSRDNQRRMLDDTNYSLDTAVHSIVVHIVVAVDDLAGTQVFCMRSNRW